MAESGKMPIDIPFGKCASTEVFIKQEEDGIGMAQEDVRTHIGNPLHLQWAKIPKHHFSTIEGRTAHPILGTPGGDLAEWLIACAMYEGLVNKELAAADVERFFRIYLKATSKMSFYYSTDRKSTELLGRIMRIDRLDLTDTPANEEEKALFLENVVLAGNLGSEHFKLLIERPNRYNTRKELVKHCIAAYFKVLWDKSAQPPIWQKLRLVTVEGHNQEKAFLKIKTAAECVANQVSPLIRPKGPEASAYVCHMQAVVAFRAELANFFADQDPKIDAAKMLESMNELGNRHLSKTIENVARTQQKKLPIWEVTLQ